MKNIECDYCGKVLKDNKYKSITLETADPAKFPDEIISLINKTPKIPISLESIQHKNEYPNPVEINQYKEFKDFLIQNFY